LATNLRDSKPAYLLESKCTCSILSSFTDTLPKSNQSPGSKLGPYSIIVSQETELEDEQDEELEDEELEEKAESHEEQLLELEQLLE